MIRSVLRAILESIRFEWRMQRALARMERNDDDEYARDTADLAAFDRRWNYCPIPLPNCQTCEPSETDSEPLGTAFLARTTSPAQNILEVADWLRSEHGPDWQAIDEGTLQQSAASLINFRAAYERKRRVPS